MKGLKKIGSILTVILFGVVVPVFLIAQAYISMGALDGTVSSVIPKESVAETFQDVRPVLHDANDYALYSVMSAERTNLMVVTNKQNMKVAVMQIGFAVISVGIAFIILGINDGGVTAGGEAAGIRLDFKTGSTGAAIFVVGAAMATVGGTLKNDYWTVPVPGYIDRGENSAGQAHARTIAIYRQCTKQQPAIADECFYKLFGSRFAGEVK